MNPNETGAAPAASGPATAGSSTAPSGASVKKLTNKEKAAQARMSEMRTVVKGELAEFAAQRPVTPDLSPKLEELKTEVSGRLDTIAQQNAAHRSPSLEEIGQVVEKNLQAHAENNPGPRIDDFRDAVQGELRAHTERNPYPEPRSNRGWFVAVLATIILCFAGLGWFVWHSNQQVSVSHETLAANSTEAIKKATEAITASATVNGNYQATVKGNTEALSGMTTALGRLTDAANANKTRTEAATKAAEELTKSVTDKVLPQVAAASAQAQTATTSQEEILRRLQAIQDGVNTRPMPIQDSPPPLPTNPPPPVPVVSPTPYGPDAGQGSVSSGRAVREREWKMYEYAADIPTDRFCAKKFRRGEVRLVQEPGAATEMTQFFSGPGFSSRKRQPSTKKVPNEGSIPTFDDADKVAWQSNKPLVVWELD